jgi:hypothetical protein
MLYTTYSEFPIETYKSYHNRTVKKHLDKITNQLRQIKDCSLKSEDKRKLLEQMREEINNRLSV